jgi:hypothetical protein
MAGAFEAPAASGVETLVVVLDEELDGGRDGASDDDDVVVVVEASDVGDGPGVKLVVVDKLTDVVDGDAIDVVPLEVGVDNVEEVDDATESASQNDVHKVDQDRDYILVLTPVTWSSSAIRQHTGRCW